MKRPDPKRRERPEKAVRLSFARPGKRNVAEAFLGGRLEILSSRGVRGPERVLVEALDAGLEGSVLVAGTREALVALAAAGLFPEARVTWLAFDAYEFHRAARRLRKRPRENLEAALGADIPPAGAHDWVLLALPQTGDAMLSAELVREASLALSPRGKLLAATDNPRDRWLGDRIREAFGAATIYRRSRRGTAYVARRQPGARPRERDFRRRFRARLFGREIELETRPGVFSHGELDEGTLALSEVASLRPDARVLDLGCGSGAVGIAAAAAAPRGCALLVDASPRAVEVAAANVRRNRVERNAAVLLAHDLSAVADASFDLVLANPPYYSDFRIARQFARDSFRVLREGGELFLVTKSPEMPEAIIAKVFGSSEGVSRRGYRVIRGER